MAGKFKKGHKKPGNSGRRRGTPNKKTIDREMEFKQFSDALFNDEDYIANFKSRIMRGRAQHIEKFIWEKRFGKEPLPIDLGLKIKLSASLAVLSKYEKVFIDFAEGSMDRITGKDDS